MLIIVAWYFAVRANQVVITLDDIPLQLKIDGLSLDRMVMATPSCLGWSAGWPKYRKL